MPTPSLILVPARFKTGKLYTPVATTSGGTVLGASGDFNVTRNTTATRVNASGLIESVASGISRLDYYTSGGTAGCPALLVEPSSQNLGWHSQTWATGTTWTLTEVTTVTGTSGTLDPLGTNLANAISPTAVSGVHTFFSNTSPATIGYVSGTIYTASVFLKQGTGTSGRYAQLTYNAIPFTQAGYANFDLQLGTVAVVSGTSADTNRAARIENYGNGWYRCRFTATCNASTNTVNCALVMLSASGDIRRPSFTGVTGDILYGFGMQLETGSVATSYIPTTTAAVTRNADVISVSGAVSGCIGQSQGTIYAEVDLRNVSTGVFRRLIDVTDGTNQNRIQIQINTTDSKIRISIFTAGSEVVLLSSLAYTGITKIALAYKNNDTTYYVNGSLVSGTTSITVPATNRIQLGSTYDSASFFNDRIRAAALYTTRLTNTELAALTTL